LLLSKIPVPAMGTMDEADIVTKDVQAPSREPGPLIPVTDPADAAAGRKSLGSIIIQAPADVANSAVIEPISKQLAEEAALAKEEKEADGRGDSKDGEVGTSPSLIVRSMSSSGQQYRGVKVDDKGKTGRRSSLEGRPFPKRPRMCRLSQKTWDTLKQLYEKMDQDGCQMVTKDKAMLFFTNFKAVSVDALFNEVDVDNSGAITAEEFIDFWLQVRANGYSEDQLYEEMEQMREGGAWVDWKDSRDTGLKKAFAFPRRPLLCRISSKVWKKVAELFIKMSEDQSAITLDQGTKFFSGQAFANVSAQAMFKEVDMLNHGTITAQEFIGFWIQVKGSGYKEQTIIEEIDLLLEGSPWVDWDDKRTT